MIDSSEEQYMICPYATKDRHRCKTRDFGNHIVRCECKQKWLAANPGCSIFTCARNIYHLFSSKAALDAHSRWCNGHNHQMFILVDGPNMPPKLSDMPKLTQILEIRKDNIDMQHVISLTTRPPRLTEGLHSRRVQSQCRV